MLSAQQIDYLTSNQRILTSNLTEEEKRFRQNHLRAKHKQSKLEFERWKRKADLSNERFTPIDLGEFNSVEEYQSWIIEDRKIRNKILDDILADDDWLWKLALKYYPDNPEIVYADTANNDNWKRKELPDKKKYNKDEED